MKPLEIRAALGAALCLLAASCAMDVPHMMKTDANLQDQVMATIVADSALAGKMAAQLLTVGPTRDSMLDQVMSNGDAAQQVMMMVAKDRTRLDAVLGLAVQDSTMKQHVLTLLKGMQMAGEK